MPQEFLIKFTWRQNIHWCRVFIFCISLVVSYNFYFCHCDITSSLQELQSWVITAKDIFSVQSLKGLSDFEMKNTSSAGTEEGLGTGTVKRKSRRLITKMLSPVLRILSPIDKPSIVGYLYNWTLSKFRYGPFLEPNFMPSALLEGIFHGTPYSQRLCNDFH